LWLRSRSRVAGSHLMARTRTMTRLASGQTGEAGTGTDQGNAACHSCSAGRLLVVAAYPDLAREAVPEVGPGAGRGPLVQERHLVTGACGVVYEARKAVGGCVEYAEMLCVEWGLSELAASGTDLVDLDPVDAFRAEVEEQDFQEVGAQKGTTVVKRGL